MNEYNLTFLSWVEAGADPASPDAPGWNSIQRADRNDIIQMIEVTAGGGGEAEPTIIHEAIVLTQLGRYELARLRAEEAR